MTAEARYPDRLVEWLFAAMMMTWGMWLLLPMKTFDNPTYVPLAVLAPESVWGVWSIAIGVIRAMALYVNGAWRRSPLIRLGCSILGIIWWLTLVFLYLQAPIEHPGAGFSWYPLFIIFEGISCWRSAADGFHARAFSRGSPNDRRR